MQTAQDSRGKATVRAPGVILWTSQATLPRRLRRQMAKDGLPVGIRHVSTPAGCLEALQDQRASGLVLDVEDRPEAALELIDRARQLDSSCLVVVLLASGLAGVASLARELGAAHVAARPAAIETLVPLLLRHLRWQLAATQARSSEDGRPLTRAPQRGASPGATLRSASERLLSTMLSDE